jgi:undecaprenyl diphosphate synthase
MAATDGATTREVAAPPAHVAIIMDGNGRWAAKRMLPRFEGHRRGVDALRRAVRAAGELGIRYLTLYSFSSENWSRPKSEVDDLMGLLKRFIRNDLAELHASNVRVRIIGEREDLEGEILGLMAEAEDLTRANTGLTLVVAFNYGARQEIARAARRLAEAVAAGDLSPAAITTETLAGNLDTAGIPDPDLVIRTSGEQRLSNFLLWQAAYAEFVFLPVLWPDFDRAVFETALREYAGRERRFGGLEAQGASRHATRG